MPPNTVSTDCISACIVITYNGGCNVTLVTKFMIFFLFTTRCLGCGHLTTSRQPDTEMWCTVPAPQGTSKDRQEEEEEEEEPQVVPEIGASDKQAQDSGTSLLLPLSLSRREFLNQSLL